ncbi:MAG: Panacea domain-containing protein [Terracidiphilus sp.]
MPFRLPVKSGKEKRLTELILYVSRKLSDDQYFGQVKLNKVVFFSDFTAFGKLGDTITGVEYQHLAEGPAARPMYPIQERMRQAKILEIETRPVFGRKQDRPVPLREPDLSIFGEDQIAIVDYWIERLRPLTGKQASDLSHDTFGWKTTRMGETISPESVFISWRTPTAKDIKRGQELAKKYGLLA